MTGRAAVYVASISPRPTDRPSLSAPQQNRETARCSTSTVVTSASNGAIWSPMAHPLAETVRSRTRFGSSVKWLVGPAGPLIR